MIRLIRAHTNSVMMISFGSLLRLIDDVLITSLWTFIYMMISFLLIASTGSRHTDALRLIPVHGSDSPNSASKAMDVK